MDSFELKKDFVHKLLKEEILRGKYARGEKLPSESALSKKLNVGKVTLRAALEKLETESFIARVHGKGTFVSHEGGGTKKNRVLAIVDRMEAFENPTIHILEGVKEAAAEHSLELLTFERPYIECMTPGEFKAVMKAENVLGVVAMLSNFQGDENILRILQGGGVPVALPHATPSDARITGFATIVVDEKSSWKEAVGHLAGNGHHRVATIINSTCPGIRGHSLPEFKSLLREHRLDLDEGLVRFIPYDRETVKGVVKELMCAPAPPTAILCYSDYFAVYVYEGLKELGLRIPEDVVVMGCCGYPGGAFLNPPLSTVDYRYDYLGRRGIDILLGSDAWFGKRDAAPPRLIAPYKFVGRESTNLRRAERMFAS